MVRDENDRLKDGDLPRDPLAGSVPYDPNFTAGGSTAVGPKALELPPFETVEELMAAKDADIHWLWHGVVAGMLITMVIGKPKKGKSTFLFALIAALERGVEFLGRATQRATAVVMSEEARSTIKQKVKRFGIEKAVFWSRSHRRPSIPFPALLSKAVETALQVGAKVIVIDTLAGWANLGPDAEKDAGHAQQLYDVLQTAAAHGLAIVVIHHARKAEGESADVARGSSALVGAADVQVHLTGTADGSLRRLNFIGRADETPEEFGYEMDRNGRLLPVTQRVLRDRRIAAARALLLPLLDAEKWLSRKAAKEGVELAAKDVNDGLEDLVSTKDAERQGAGKPKSPFEYRLTAPHGERSVRAVRPTGSVLDLPLAAGSSAGGESGSHVPVPPYRVGTPEQTPAYLSRQADSAVLRTAGNSRTDAPSGTEGSSG